MKRYRVYIRKPGSNVWTYTDTYDGAALAWMACRIAWMKGFETKTRDAAQHADVAEYVQADKVVLS